MYAVCRCANGIEAFRYRFLDGKVVLFKHIDTAFTSLNRDTGLFKVVNVPLRGSVQEYVETAGRIAREQKEYFTGPLGNGVFQCSSMPWITYTHISHINSGKKDNAMPLFDWGKFDTETLEMKEAEMFIEGDKAVLVKDTSFKGLWKMSFTLKEF